MRPSRSWFLFLSMILWLCAFGCERRGLVITLTQEEIQQRINTRFPVEKNLLLVGVTLRDPKVVLREESDRIAVDLAVDVNLQPLAKFSGSIGVSGVPFYDANRKAFFLHLPSIDRLQMPGLQPEQEPQVRKAIEAVAQPALQQFPVYELSDSDTKEITAAYVLREVRVRNGKLQAVLGLPK